MTLLTHLVCTSCQKKIDHSMLQTVCSCGKVLFAQYDLETAKETLTKNSMAGRKNNIWRMSEIMPCSIAFQYSLGEGGTPLLKLEDKKGIIVYAKDEGQNPTGSFKIRGLCTAVSRGIELGVTDFVIPTAGNAGAALSAMTARTQTNAHIYMPKDAPEMIKKEIEAFHADLHLIDGLISDASKLANQEGLKQNWFNVSTLKEPYRVEGKKTMGLEILEQLQWEMPEVIIYPTGGGTGIVGMMKAFDELEKIGIIGSERARMVSVQSEGCAPIVSAFNKKAETVEFWENASTIAQGLRVPSAIGDYLILQALYKTNGIAQAVSDNRILESMKIAAKNEGLFLSPEAAATYTCLFNLIEDRWIDRGERVVLFCTASGLTTPNYW